MSNESKITLTYGMIEAGVYSRKDTLTQLMTQSFLDHDLYYAWLMSDLDQIAKKAWIRWPLIYAVSVSLTEKDAELLSKGDWGRLGNMAKEVSAFLGGGIYTEDGRWIPGGRDFDAEGVEAEIERILGESAASGAEYIPIYTMCLVISERLRVSPYRMRNVWKDLVGVFGQHGWEMVEGEPDGSYTVQVAHTFVREDDRGWEVAEFHPDVISVDGKTYSGLRRITGGKGAAA